MTWRHYEIWVEGGDDTAAETLFDSLTGWAWNLSNEWGSGSDPIVRVNLNANPDGPTDPAVANGLED